VIAHHAEEMTTKAMLWLGLHLCEGGGVPGRGQDNSLDGGSRAGMGGDDALNHRSGRGQGTSPGPRGSTGEFYLRRDVEPPPRSAKKGATHEEGNRRMASRGCSGRHGGCVEEDTRQVGPTR
jgi:hypothetical protein